MSKKKFFEKWIVFCPKAKHKYFMDNGKKVCPACGELIESEGHIVSENK